MQSEASGGPWGTVRGGPAQPDPNYALRVLCVPPGALRTCLLFCLFTPLSPRSIRAENEPFRSFCCVYSCGRKMGEDSPEMNNWTRSDSGGNLPLTWGCGTIRDNVPG
jgi:hypothetical protein